MKIQVKLFALARDLAGTDHVQLQLHGPATIAAVRAALGQQFPALQGVLASCAFSVDNEYAPDQATITANQEIACLPPVSGG